MSPALKIIGVIISVIGLGLAAASYFFPQFGQQIVSGLLPANKPNWERLLAQSPMGTTMAYVEAVAGPAMRTDANGRSIYVVDGCQLDVLYERERVVAFGVHLTTACNIEWDSIRRYFNEGRNFPPANQLHFSDVLDQWPVSLDRRPCMVACGNGGGSGPVYSLYFGGSNADNNQYFTFTRHFNTGTEAQSELDSIARFGDRVRIEIGGEWYQDRPEVCAHDLLPAAKATLSNLRVDYIEVGFVPSNRFAAFCDEYTMAPL